VTLNQAQTPQVGWSVGCPEDGEAYRACVERLDRLLGEPGPLISEIARFILAGDGHLLSGEPATLWPIVVIRSCASAGGDWHAALWPAVALECAMTAADVFDDLADGESTDAIQHFGSGAVLTTALGLMTLASSAVLRATDDGVPEQVAIRLGRLLGDGIAAAADGQARGLVARLSSTSVVDAYQLSASKSGPLGELATRLGAMVATADSESVNGYARFGWHLGVYCQLINDALDVLPDRPMKKRDVRDGSPTVPIVFTGSSGAPTRVDNDDLVAWELAERRRIADEGGVAVAEVLAIAERIRAEEALDALDRAGHRTDELRKLLVVPNQNRC